MGTVAVTLMVEVEEKFRASATGLYSVHANIPERLINWVDTYAEAYDNGIELMARYEGIGSFSVIKEFQRAEPVAEPG